jgi:hypothetical protein
VRNTLPQRAGLTGLSAPTAAAAKPGGLERKAWTYECVNCGRQTSITAGTIMHHFKLPLAAWFWAAYLMATRSNGISALQLQRQRAFRSYKTAWLLCANEVDPGFGTSRVVGALAVPS